MPGDPAPGSLAQKDASTLGNMLCRDFLRGVCYRGENCKFLHSEQHAPAANSQLPVCRDFQNGTCNRRNCKYAHIYSTSGFYDPHTITSMSQGGSIRNLNDPYTQNYGKNECRYEEVFKTRAGPNDPICKDFQSGYCQRGENCRYKHISYVLEPLGYRDNISRMPPPLPSSSSHIPIEPHPYPYSAVNTPINVYGTNMPHHFSSINTMPTSVDKLYTNVPPLKRPHIADNTGPEHSEKIVPNSFTNDFQYEIDSLKKENTRLNEELVKCKAEINSLKDELSRYRHSSNVNNNVANTDETKTQQDSKSSSIAFKNTKST